ncbi:MAG: LCP family protein [Candidatus Saccharimonadales bacterium]
MADKYDDFRPRRSGSVDGFLTGAGQQPRRPSFRGNEPRQTSPPPATPIRPQTNRQEIALPSPRPIAEDARRTATAERTKEAFRLVTEPQDEPQRITPDRPKKGWRRGRKQADPETGHGRLGTKRHKSKKRTFAKVLGVLLLAGLLAFGFRFYRDMAKITGNSNPFSLLGVFNPADLKNENGRVNVLVAGNSADDVGHNGGDLTDSIMVLSIDTQKNTAMMLSIPRDLWVRLPGEGHMKINSVYPLEGMDGLKSVVENELGLAIHYTALINYAAFRDLVDAVGGITITIKSDDPRGIYDSSLDYTSRTCCALAKYPNGPVNLDGKQALNLARARGEGYNSYGFDQADFTRTEHQRQMLLAIKDKASNPAVVANPFKVSNLFSAVAGNVKTDLQINEIQTLYYYSKKVDANKIDSFNLNTLKGQNTTMLTNYTSPNGQSALIPAAGLDDYTAIAAQIRRTFNASPLTKEAASVMVLNSTQYVGLARLQTNKLLEKGMDVAGQGNFATTQNTTTIIDNSNGQKPNTLAYLKTTYNATVVTDTVTATRYPDADFILILGKNAMPNPAATSSN